MSRNPAVSTGRGGAGNFREGRPPTSDDLSTPTIKESRYTTGRGGRGNMAENDPQKPEIARASQDITPLPRREGAPGEVFHYGRGGEGNKIRTGSDADGKPTEGTEEGRQHSKERTGSGVFEKGRDLIRSMKKDQEKKSGSGINESAIN